MVHASHASHIGAILSVTDIIAVLYADIMNIDAHDPKKADRDRLVLSKGHAGVAGYAALAEMGFFPIEELGKYYCDASVYSGHVSHYGVPGIELSTGSFGPGSRSPVEWRWRQNAEMRPTAFLRLWEMASAMKAWYGKLRGLPASSNWTISR